MNKWGEAGFEPMGARKCQVGIFAFKIKQNGGDIGYQYYGGVETKPRVR
jgi:hypothetical protein